MNTYTLDNEICTECDKESELVYHQYANAIHCQACGTWFETNGDILSDKELTNIMEGTNHGTVSQSL
jgi:hypothetical protein